MVLLDALISPTRKPNRTWQHVGLCPAEFPEIKGRTILQVPNFEPFQDCMKQSHPTYRCAWSNAHHFLLFLGFFADTTGAGSGLLLALRFFSLFFFFSLRFLSFLGAFPSGSGSFFSYFFADLKTYGTMHVCIDALGMCPSLATDATQLEAETSLWSLQRRPHCTWDVWGYPRGFYNRHLLSRLRSS